MCVWYSLSSCFARSLRLVMTESSYQHAWKPEGYEIQSLENMVFAISCKFSTVCYTVDVFERMNTYGNVNCTQVVSDFY